jgi:hypothetical protein
VPPVRVVEPGAFDIPDHAVHSLTLG